MSTSTAPDPPVWDWNPPKHVQTPVIRDAQDTRTRPVATQTLPRFLTLGGATVQVVEHAYTHHVYDYTREQGWSEDHGGYAWRCLGCDTQGSHYVWTGDEKFPAELPLVRDVANDHAHECRAMPKETETR